MKKNNKKKYDGERRKPNVNLSLRSNLIHCMSKKNKTTTQMVVVLTNKLF